MQRNASFRRLAGFAQAAAILIMASTAAAQNGGANAATPVPPGGWSPELGQLTGHPLEPALDRAYKALKQIDREIKDYTCTLVKRERVDGKLTEQEFIFAKVRQQPFSVYMYFLPPPPPQTDHVSGREVIYVAGQNNGNLIAHEAKGIKKLLGAIELKPNSTLAMLGNRYPITEVGVLNLTRRLVEVGENDRKFGECTVNFVPNSKINGRSCTLIQVEHPNPRKNFRYHKALIYMDDELNIPVRFEAYDWPQQAGGQPLLLEEYTYVNMKFNVGLTDADFDPKNPKYNFTKK